MVEKSKGYFKGEGGINCSYNIWVGGGGGLPKSPILKKIIIETQKYFLSFLIAVTLRRHALLHPGHPETTEKQTKIQEYSTFNIKIISTSSICDALN